MGRRNKYPTELRERAVRLVTRCVTAERSLPTASVGVAAGHTALHHRCIATRGRKRSFVVSESYLG